MGTRLHVANLPLEPNAAALRAHFSACGPVSDVQIVAGRHAGRGQATAYVRMSSEAGARRALAELNRLPFGGQILTLEAAPNETGGESLYSTRQKDPIEVELGARITVQFREPANMTYELDCGGVALVVRVFFQTDDGKWRISVQSGSDRNAPGSASTAAS